MKQMESFASHIFQRLNFNSLAAGLRYICTSISA